MTGYHIPPREDKSPYPTVLQNAAASFGGVHLSKQDNVSMPDSMPILRRLIAYSKREHGYHIGLALWRNPPREWPPAHSGDGEVGMQLSYNEAAALWSSLGEYLIENREQTVSEG